METRKDSDKVEYISKKKKKIYIGLYSLQNVHYLIWSSKVY